MPSIRDLSKSLKRKKTLLDEETCRSIAVLVKSGFTLQDAMRVLEDRRNTDIFHEIRTRLAKGENLASFFSGYCPKAYRSSVSGFLRYLPFDTAVMLGITVSENDKKKRETVMREMLYPVLLMCGMLAGIFLFSQYVLPRMLDLLKGFGGVSGGMDAVRRAVQILSAFLLAVFGISAISAAVLLSRPLIQKTYAFMTVHHRGSLLIRAASEDFTLFFLECVRMNISTINTLKLLQQIPEKPLVAMIASELDRILLSGVSFDQAVGSSYVEEPLSRFFRTAFYASECEKMLEGYLEMSRVRTKVMIRRFTLTVQSVSYLMIGAMLVFVYLVMMMPLRMLQNI